MIRDIPQALQVMCAEIRQFMDMAVIGLSGGADSTLVAVLCSLALGKEQVYAVHMPANSTDEAGFNRRSQRTAQNLGIHSLLIPIHNIADAINSACLKGLGAKELSRVNAGNARARARMAVLYGVCHHLNEETGKRVRVVGTGNLSEDFIGYDTKGGDALGDLFPIGELFKSEVYQLLDYFRDQGVLEEEMIDRTPSAGFWLGHTDEEELGYTYNEMEGAVRKYLNNQLSPETAQEGVERFVLERHLRNKHKHEAPPVISLRRFCD